MSEPRQESFDLHLPGLLKVLAEHLYASRDVGVRELIQNAHDSCMRRQFEGGEPTYRPIIRIHLDQRQRTLTISDNGSGLDGDEVRDFLSTIGRGYTRVLREELEFSSREEAEALIGQFGLGFLSAFLLGSEVRAVTRSMKDGAQGILWRSQGDATYETSDADRDEIGTTIELDLKESAWHLLDEQTITDIVRQYADFIGIPMHIQDDPHPVNSQFPPWDADDPGQAAEEHIARAFGSESPLLVIPLRNWQLDLKHDRITIPMSGYLFVPAGSVASIYEFGDMNVYIRRMFICDRQRDLLPEWARFVRGIIDCPVLQPTASREDIHRDDLFVHCQMAIEQQLVEALRRTAQEDRDTWRLIISGHSDLIMSWAVREDEFFRAVADFIELRTSRGTISIREYLNASGNVFYYVSRENGSLQEQLLGEGRDVPVIDATWFCVRPFVEKYAAEHGEIEVVSLDDDTERLLQPVHDARFDGILDEFDRQEISAAIAQFKPSEVPALVIYPKSARLISEARDALSKQDIPDPLAALVDEYVDSVQPEDERELKGKLHLNASSTLIQQLAELPPSSSQLAATCALLFQLARLVAGHMLTARDAVTSYRVATASLERLIRDESV